jgi:hypothetical protein
MTDECGIRNLPPVQQQGACSDIPDDTRRRIFQQAKIANFDPRPPRKRRQRFEDPSIRPRPTLRAWG